MTKFENAVAVKTNQVVVAIHPDGRFEQLFAMAGFDFPRQSKINKKLQRAVHRCNPDTGQAGLDYLMPLVHGQMTFCLEKNLKNDFSPRGQAVAAGLQISLKVGAWIWLSRGHEIFIDNDSQMHYIAFENDYQSIFLRRIATMISVSRRGRDIKICSGAGCKAWGSEAILSELGKLGDVISAAGLNVIESPCFKHCGGGACLQKEEAETVKKFRDPQDAVDFLLEDCLVTVEHV